MKKMFLALLLVTLSGIASFAQEEAVSFPRIERGSFDYFFQTALTNGLMPHRLGQPDIISTAANGYYLAALCIGSDQGWISRETAARHTLATLTSLAQLPQFHGFWAEFYDARTQAPLPVTHPLNKGAHTRSTALLAAGLLTAGQYFNDPDSDDEQVIRARTSTLFDQIEWRHMLRENDTLTGQALADCWAPVHEFENSRPLSASDDLGGGMLAYLLAIAAPTYGLEPEMWRDCWAPTYRWHNEGTSRFIACPPLEAHYLAHAWLDLRCRPDRFADYHRNSSAAIRANRRFSLLHLYPDLGLWGLTDCIGPRGFEPFGYPPLRGSVEEQAVIAPPAALASVLFTPELAADALARLLAYRDQIWGPFGFYDSFSPKTDWFQKGYSSSLQGLLLILADNQANGLIHRLFTSHPAISSVLDRIGFARMIADFEEHDPEDSPYLLLKPAADYAASLTAEEYRDGRASLQVTFNKRHNPNAALTAYPVLSDFSAAPYLSLWFKGANSLGLVLTDRIGRSLPLLQPLKGPITHDDWRQLYFPLPDEPSGSFDLSAVQRIALVADPGQTDTRGTFWLDSLRLVSDAPLLPPPPPTAITVQEGRLPGEALLRWTAGSGPTPYAFHIRFSAQSIRDERTFARAPAPQGIPPQGIPGATREWRISGLPTTQPLTFAIQAESLQGHRSDIAVSEPLSLSLTRPPPVFSLDSFDTDAPRLDWSPSGPSIQIERATDASLEGDACLEVAYRKTSDADRRAYLTAPLDVRDISRYNYLSVWVAGKAALAIRLVDTAGHAQETPPAEATKLDAWTPLFFDLSKLDELDRTAIRRIMILVEPGKTGVEGIIFLDSLSLTLTRN